MGTETKKKKKFKLPHIFVLLTAIIVVCAVATWILPAGEFDRQVNEAGTEVVVPGTYHTVDSSPVGPFETVKAMAGALHVSTDCLLGYSSPDAPTSKEFMLIEKLRQMTPEQRNIIYDLVFVIDRRSGKK